MSAWKWLKEEIALRVGPDAADEIWTEYSRRLALDVAAAKRKRQVERLKLAQAAAALGDERAARRVATLKAWLAEH